MSMRALEARRSPMRHRLAVVLVLCTLVFGTALPLFPQSPTATVNGQVRDTSGAVVQDADVQLINDHTNVKYPTKTNGEGIYSVTSVPPGTYRIQVSKAGFKTLIKPDIILNVLDARAINFDLPVGAVSETITVEAGTPLVNTESATVSTVVDRQFAENLPMNGRSFQSLIQLTPGVVLTAGNGYDQGQYSINGQRGTSNYWMVDGVSANIGINASSVPGGGAAGALQAFSVQGGTNSLVSVDAMQEFRIETSSYAPEFGRTPGGQVSIATRSGTNRYHGTLFDYLRNDLLDANDWFANNKGLKKPEERQNDFGGTFSGPILKNRTFFFFSYEGLRLRLPQVLELTVPSLNARQNAISGVQPFLNGFPVPNGQDLGNGVAEFNQSFSNNSTLDATSLRIDHRFSEKLSLIGRYNYSPSETVWFGGSEISPIRITTRTLTVGGTWAASHTIVDDLRFNYSRTRAISNNHLSTVGGAVVPSFSSLLPAPFTSQDSRVSFGIFSLSTALGTGPNSDNVQRQVNIVNTLSFQKASHSLKFGIDYRRLAPSFGHPAYTQGSYFLDVPSAMAGNLYYLYAIGSVDAHLLFQNLGIFAQDTWRLRPRLTLTYGVRWDVDFAPSTTSGPSLAAVTQFGDLATLALAPAGTPAFKTTYNNFAPRLGLAYQLTPKQNCGTVLRGGLGLFYDLATQEAASAATYSNYPFGSVIYIFGGSWPVNPTTAVPPPVTPASLASGFLTAFDPKLKLPYTLEWNVALEQGLGTGRALSASYIGAAGRRLTQSEYGYANSNIFLADLVTNAGTSNYSALQVQFQQRLRRGLQLLTSYAWAHSIDTASASSFGNLSNYYSVGYGGNRGSSDSDIRHGFSAGLTYELPSPKLNNVANAILHGWSIQSVVQARSALPVDVNDSALSYSYTPGQPFADIRPDLTPNIPLYLYGSQYPGGKALNDSVDPTRPGCKGPFCPPPTNANGIPLRQGNLGRNALRAFGAVQWDWAVHRDFPIRESVKLQFRAEMFNVLNHPNFGAPIGDISSPLFGRSTQTLGNSLSQTGSSLSALYQIGGPRSMQFAMKLFF